MTERPKQNGESLQENKTKRPTTSQMVNTAIKALNDRRGSSLKAIIKYMEAHYFIEAKKFMPYIKSYIKKSLMNGTIVQKSGGGLSGSFKLSKTAQETEVKKKKQKKSKKVSEGDAEKQNVKKPNSLKAAKSGSKKLEQKAENVKMKNKIKEKPDETKKTKTKTKSGNIKDGKVKRRESKKSRLKTVTTTDPAKLKKIRISILNGKLIKRKSVGGMKKKSKAKKVAEEQ